MIQLGKPGEVQCTAGTHEFEVNGSRTARGIISYYATLALVNADTMTAWLQQTLALCNADVAQGRLPQTKALSLTITGDPGQKLFGAGGPLRPTRAVRSLGFAPEHNRERTGLVRQSPNAYDSPALFAPLR
jgi:hypothetical protein